MSRHLFLVLTCTLLALAACAPSAQPTAEPPAGNILSPVASPSTGAPTSPATLPPAAPTLAPTRAATATAAPTYAAPKAAKNSAQALEEIARRIYAASSTPEDLEPFLIGVMTAFGVPPLGPDDVDKAAARYKQGLPLILLSQIGRMAEEFKTGDLYTLDSFIAAANARGARRRDTNQPLTREYLTQAFARYTGKSQFTARQVLPAFVLALGQARVKQNPAVKPDPVWGDGLLDPLQTTLLLYSVSYAGAAPLPPTARGSAGPGTLAGRLRLAPLPSPLEAQSFGEHPIVGWITDQISGEIQGEVQEQIGLPLDQQEAAQVTLCASLILYGHKTEVKAAPDKLYHKDGIKPSAARIEVTVRFVDDYHSKTKPIDRWLIETLANCELPVQGLARGAQLDWSVSDGLREHGQYDITQSETNANGSAWASWRTVPETTPESQRSFYTQREAVGTAIVRVSGLVEGWDPLEKVVNLLRDTGAVGQARLSVTYYEKPAYRVDSQFGVYSKVPVKGNICALDKPFTLQVDGRNPSGGNYTGTFKFTPSSPTAGSWVHAATSCVTGGKCGKESGGSTYQVEGIAEGRPVIKMHATSASSAVDGYVGTWPWPEWEMVLKPMTGACVPD